MTSRTTLFALLLAAAPALAGTVGVEENQAHPKITGTVSSRERVALPPDAILRVRLEVAAAPEMPARRVAEVTIPTGGKQLPIPFALPYAASEIRPSQRYLVRATIFSGDTVLLVSRTPYPALTRGAPAKLEIQVDPAAAGRRPRPRGSITSVGLAGTNWRLVALGETAALALPEGRQASLFFDGVKKRISGSTGCNRFLGTYAPGEGGALKLEPSGMTVAACPDDATAQEAAFLAALRATTAYRIDGAKLELSDGDRVLARFESGSTAPARSE